MSLVQSITLVIAVLGAVLGFVNTWHALDKSRLKLKVVPKHAIPVGGADSRLTFGIEITNLSAFPVTICEAGVLYGRSSKRGVIIDPVFADGGKWPKRLEPRSSISVYNQMPENTRTLRIRAAYAETACGSRVEGTSPALRQMSREFSE